MDTSIKALYDNPKVPQGQKDYFWQEVKDLLESSENKNRLVFRILQHIWTCYDMGGISCHRSLRSDLIDKAKSDFKVGNIEHFKRIVTLLIAMYHNHEHIKKYDWYDFEPKYLYDSSLEHRVMLSVIAIIFGVENNIPDISHFTHQDFLEFLK